MPVGMGGLIVGINGANNFSPLSLSPTVWLRSDLGISQSISHPGNVQSWADQSGNGYVVSQGTTADQPTYASSGGLRGLPKLNFGSTTGLNTGLQLIPFTFTQYPCEIFAVVNPTLGPTGTNQVIVDTGSTNNYTVLGNSNEYSVYNGSYIYDTTNLPVANIPVVIDICDLGNSNSFISVNGDTPSVGSMGNQSQLGDALTIGNYEGFGGYNWVGDIYEVVIFNFELSSTQRSQMLSYVTARYGIGT